MKMFFMLAGAILVASSCSKRDIGGDAGPSELILSGQVQLKSSAAASVTKDDAGAVQLDPLPATDIGVYVLTTSGDSPTDFGSTAWKNESFVSDASGVISGGNVKLRTGTSYAIYAYAPRVAALTDAKAVPVKHGEDILYAVTPDVVGTAGGTKAKLAFKHAGAQIGFKLKCSDETVDLKDATLEVSGFFKEGALDLATGLMTLTDQTQKLSDKTGAKKNILITGSQMDFSVKVSDVPGRSEPFTGTFSPTLVAGESYLYTVNVNLDAGAPITFTATTTDWENVELPDPVPVD